MRSLIVGLLLFSTTAYAGPFIAPNVSADGVTLQMRASGELFCASTTNGAGGTVAITNGGTGATTAPAALTALGASPLAGSSSLTTVGTLTNLAVSSDATINGITVGRGAGSVSYNTAIGLGALYNNGTGGNNTATGQWALYANTGSNNTATGSGALTDNTTGMDNTATGNAALTSNTTGMDNTANGSGALENNTTGSYNTAFGYQAGYFISGGSVPVTTSSNSLFLGPSTEALANGDANEIVIGYGAIGHGSYTTTIGGPSTVKTYITGIVTTSGYTVASLPAGVLGARAFVTDAVSPTFLGTLVGGGSSFCPVVYNGTAWIAE